MVPRYRGSGKQFPYFGVLGRQKKHLYVGRILKKSLRGPICARFFTTTKDPFGQSGLRLGMSKIDNIPYRL